MNHYESFMLIILLNFASAFLNICLLREAFPQKSFLKRWPPVLLLWNPFSEIWPYFWVHIYFRIRDMKSESEGTCTWCSSWSASLPPNMLHLIGASKFWKMKNTEMGMKYGWREAKDIAKGALTESRPSKDSKYCELKLQRHWQREVISDMQTRVCERSVFLQLSPYLCIQ